MMWRSKKKTAGTENDEETAAPKAAQAQAQAQALAAPSVPFVENDGNTVASSLATAEPESEKEEENVQVASSEARQSFFQSLFKRNKSYRGAAEQKDEEPATTTNEQDVSATRDLSETSENQQDTTNCTEAPEEESSSLLKKSRWPSLWRLKNAGAEEEQEAVEVEMKPDSSLQIHDSNNNKTRKNVVVRRYPKDPNRPSVYEEALEMLTGSLLIYLFADIRVLARDGIITAPEILEDPTPIRQVMEAVVNHKEALEQYAIDHESLQQRLTALKDMHEKAVKVAQSTGNASTLVGKILEGGPQAALAALTTAEESQPAAKESVLAQFNDETATQGVVYGIAVNHLRKRITIIFRGSVTQQDFLTDARSAQKKVENPVHDILGVEEAPKRIGIHTGFYTYLFAKVNEEEETLRWERILEDAKKLLKENPGYRLYLTGHSLGGALSTLCGFYAAIDDELVENGPVVVISIASPQVGHFKFCESFHALERLGRLQHLRVANKEDMITHLPFLHIKAHVLSPVAVAVWGAGNLYKHCGIHLELKSVEEENQKKTEHFVCHPKSRDNPDQHQLAGRGSHKHQPTYSEEWHKAVEAAKLLYEAVVPLRRGDFEALTLFHSCTEYEARLMASQEYLSSVTLDQLYQDEGIVGAALAKHLSHQNLPEDDSEAADEGTMNSFWNSMFATKQTS